MKHYLNQNGDIYKSITYLNNKIIDHDDKINHILSYFEPNELLYKEGTYYDAYSDILNIFNKALKELIIIDGYIDKNILDIIRNIKVDVKIITKTNPKLNTAINIYQKQYNNLKVYYNDLIHDRYFIIDRKVIYHSGASINYAGKRLFSIDKIKDSNIINEILDIVKSIISK